MRRAFTITPLANGRVVLAIQTYVLGDRRLQLVHAEVFGEYPDKAFAMAAGIMQLVRYRQEANMQRVREELRKANKGATWG